MAKKNKAGAKPEVDESPPEIYVGLGYDDALKETQREPVPADWYKVSVMHFSKFKPTNKDGRPNVLWVMEIIEHPEHTGHRLFYNTPLPWERPMGEGQTAWDTSGLNFLVDLTEALGLPWRGEGFNIGDYVDHYCMGYVTKVQSPEGNWRNQIERLRVAT